jgi:hypothetical protein
VSYLRHNVIIHRPVEIFEYKGKLLDSGLTGLLDFCRASRIVTAGRKSADFEEPQYEPYGEASGYKP